MISFLLSLCFATIDGAIKTCTMQCCERQDETNLESRRFILQHLRQSLKKRSSIYSFPNNESTKFFSFSLGFKSKQSWEATF